MAFDERLLLLLLGGLVGFVLGYLVRLAQEIRVKVDEVDSIVKEDHDILRKHDESGFMTNRWIANISMLVVVTLALIATVVSQKASNDVVASQGQQDKIIARQHLVISCFKNLFGEVLVSLNERSTYSQAMATANIDLQESQSKFFSILRHQPP